MINTLLFDLDGTLINTIQDLANATDYTLNQFGFEATYSLDDYKIMVGNGVSKLVERAFNNRISKEQLEVAINVFKQRYNEKITEFSKPYDGIVDMVHNLANYGFNIAVVTNKPDECAKRLVYEFFSVKDVPLVVGQKDGIPRKPDPAQVNVALNYFNVKNENCVFIGDSKTDIETAINSSLKSVGVLWGFRQKNELLCANAEHLSSSVNELEFFLKKLQKSVDI